MPACTLVLLCVLSTVRAVGADAPEALQRLKGAAEVTSLLSVEKPWHLKLQISFYDKSAAVTGEGNFERWHDGSYDRLISTFGGVSRAVLQRDKRVFREIQGEAIPQAAETLLRAILHPGPYAADLSDITPDLRPTTFGKIKMDCIMLSRRMNHVNAAPLGLFPTYCLYPEDHLSATIHAGNQTVVIERIGKFLNREISTSVSLLQDGTLVARARVLELSTFAPRPDEFAPGENLVETTSGVRVSGGVLAGKKVSGSVPSYPEAERQRRASGAVVLQALIGTDGHIYELVPMSAPEPDFAVAALVAVRDWTYTPYLLNGVPTEVTSTITVNFNMNSQAF